MWTDFTAEGDLHNVDGTHRTATPADVDEVAFHRRLAEHVQQHVTAALRANDKIENLPLRVLANRAALATGGRVHFLYTTVRVGTPYYVFQGRTRSMTVKEAEEYLAEVLARHERF